MRGPAAGKEAGASAVTDSVDAGGAGADQQLLKKGPWTAAEDAILKAYVKKYGEGNWNAVQKNTGLQRCGKSCRLRWTNHLRPNLKKGAFTAEEEMLILQLHANFGNKWSHIANNLPGRTDNEIKNYWNTRIKRRKRAGLPLYPLEIQQQIALRSHRDGQAVQWMAASQPALNPASHLVSPYPNFPSSAQYGPFPPPFQSPPSFFAKTKLPSSQFFSCPGGEQMAPLPQGNSGLLDALLQESHQVGDLLSSKYLHMDSFGKSRDLDCSIDDILSLHILPNFYPTEASNALSMNGFSHLLPLPGIQMKQEVKEIGNQDASTLLDMIPAQTRALKTVFSDCNSNSGGEFSNGPSSAVTTEDDIGPVEPGWAFGSFPWDNMPSIHGEFHFNGDSMVGT